MSYIVLLLFIALMCSLSVNYIQLKNRGNDKKVLNNILMRLDLAISDTKQIEIYDESLDSAITERLNRLVNINRLNQNQADREQKFVKTIISDISHQIKTPLTNIMLYAGILNEKLSEYEDHEMIVKILTQAEKLDFFMKELVRSSYLETEMIHVNVCNTSIDELISRSCQSVEVFALKKQIKICIQESNKIGLFDLKWTIEALTNVLDNAIKYSSEQSVITIKTIFYESFFCIQVIDHGIGIREEEQGLIFERFYRSKAVAKEQGLGIGLYLVRQIISKQNGYVKVQSKLGIETIFSIFLPNAIED